MRSLLFEGGTWEFYEAIRQKDKRLHKTRHSEYAVHQNAIELPYLLKRL